MLPCATLQKQQILYMGKVINHPPYPQELNPNHRSDCLHEPQLRVKLLTQDLERNVASLVALLHALLLWYSEQMTCLHKEVHAMYSRTSRCRGQAMSQDMAGCSLNAGLVM